MANNNNGRNGNNQQRNNDPVRFEILEHISVLANKDNGWTKEVNIVSWNGGAGKIDVREWDPNHARMSRGVTLFDDEAELLIKALTERLKLGEESLGSLAGSPVSHADHESQADQLTQTAQA
jgi:hypothetical protein